MPNEFGFRFADSKENKPGYKAFRLDEKNWPEKVDSIQSNEADFKKYKKAYDDKPDPYRKNNQPINSATNTASTSTTTSAPAQTSTSSITTLTIPVPPTPASNIRGNRNRTTGAGELSLQVPNQRLQFLSSSARQQTSNSPCPPSPTSFSTPTTPRTPDASQNVNDKRLTY